MSYFITCLKKYATFSGRARRKEYWSYTIIASLILSLLAFIDVSLTGGFIYLIASIGLLIPTYAVIVRRLHDTNKSGWWFFISLIPLIGGIWLIVLLCTDSTPGPNNYGENPKEL